MKIEPSEIQAEADHSQEYPLRVTVRGVVFNLGIEYIQCRNVSNTLDYDALMETMAYKLNY